MSLDFHLHLQTPSSLDEVADTVLGPAPDPDSVTGGFHGRVAPDVYTQVSEVRPQTWDPVVVDLAVDYTVEVSFTLDKFAPLPPQVTAVIAAAARAWTHLGGAGALLYQADIVVLRWSDDGLVVNEGSSFTPDALAVVGSAARVEPIPWE